MNTRLRNVFGDHGYATVLVHEALELLRDNAITVKPVYTCVQRFVANHTEFLDLVAVDA